MAPEDIPVKQETQNVLDAALNNFVKHSEMKPYKMYFFVNANKKTFYMEVFSMISCTEKCKYQKNGECTYEIVSSKNTASSNSTCMYFEQE